MMYPWNSLVDLFEMLIFTFPLRGSQMASNVRDILAHVDYLQYHTLWW